MRVLAIVPSIYNTSPGQRYRIEQWEPILESLGAEVKYLPFESPKLNKYLYSEGNFLHKSQATLASFLKRFKDSLAVGRYDLVYLFREAALVGPAVFEKLISLRKIPIVYDFDDAIFLPHVSQTNSKFNFLKSPKKTGVICKIASHVTVGNKFLAEYAGRYNDKVTIIPSTIDTLLYQATDDYNKNSVPTIVWSGSITTLKHLKTLSSTLQELARTETFKLQVIGAADFQLDGVNIENVRWNAQTEASDLAKGDIGIMPLPDDSWSRGKCGMKALQYMGMGIPTVCSAIGANTEIINEGENGFLADDKAQWLSKLKMLLHSVELRSRIGKAGRQTVEQKYSAQIQAPRLFQVFKNVVGTSLKNG